MAEYQVPARIRRLRIEDRQPLPGVSVVGAERRLDFLTAGDGLVNATYADTRRFPPYPQVLTDFVSAAMAGGLSYTPYRGDPAVRRGLAEAVSGFLGVGVDPDLELLVTPGSQAGLFLAVGSMVSDGDRVIVIDPDYLANERIVRFFGGVVDPVPLSWPDGTGSLDEDALAAAIARRPRLIMLSNPNNPTGAVYRRETIERVAEAALRADAYVLVDELYARLLYDGRVIDHLIAIDGMRERCVTLLGPSKTESMSGYRVGVAVGPPAVIEAMEDLLSVSALRAPAYAQRAMNSWLRDDHAFVAERVRDYQRLRDLTVAALRRIPGVSVQAAGGTAYLFPQVGDGLVGDQRIAEALLNEAGVIVNPGYQFGAAGQGHFRLCFAQDEAAWLPALDRIGAALRAVLASAALPAGPGRVRTGSMFRLGAGRGALGPERGDFRGLGYPADISADGVQRGLVQLVADGPGRVAEHDHVVVVVGRVAGGGLDADVRGHAAEHDRLDAHAAQGQVQRGRDEAAVPVLDDLQLALGRADRGVVIRAPGSGHDQARPFFGLQRLPGRRAGPGRLHDAQEDDGDAGLASGVDGVVQPLDGLLDGRHVPADLGQAAVAMAEVILHVHDDQRRVGRVYDVAEFAQDPLRRPGGPHYAPSDVGLAAGIVVVSLVSTSSMVSSRSQCWRSAEMSVPRARSRISTPIPSRTSTPSTGSARSAG